MALAALAVVGIALSAYALTLAGVVPPGGDRDRAGPTLGRVTDELAVDSVVDPGTLESGLAAAPPGYEVRITLTAGDLTWTAGPPAPPGADAAARPISVRLGPAEVWPGRLRVEVWT